MLSKIKKGVGLGARAAEAALKPKKTARDEAIIEAREASRRGFLEGSAVTNPAYHATTKSFKQFSPHLLGEERKAGTDRLGFWFSENPGSTEFYIHDPTFQAEFKEGANIIPAYLRMLRPYRMDADEFYDLSKKNVKAGEKLKKQLQTQGFDGVVAETGDGNAYAVFEPTQIKSAIGMEGRYDIEDPDITKAAGGAVDAYQAQQQSQSKRAQDVAAYKEGKIGADELLKYYPGLTAAMIEEQLAEMAEGGKVDSSDYEGPSLEDIINQGANDRAHQEWLENSSIQMLNFQLDDTLDKYRKGLVGEEALMRFFPGYTEYDISRMFGVTDQSPRNVKNMVPPVLTPKVFRESQSQAKEMERNAKRFPEMQRGFQLANGGPIEVKKKAGGPVFSQDQVFADLGDPSTVMTFGSLAMANGGEVKMQSGGGSRQAIQEQLSAGVPVFMSKGPEGQIARDIVAQEEKERERQEAERRARMQAKPFSEKFGGGYEAFQTLQSALGRSLAAPFVALSQGEEAARKFSEDIKIPESEYGLYALERTGEFLDPLAKALQESKITDAPYMPELGFTYIPGLGRQVADIARRTGKMAGESIPPALKDLPVGMSIEAVGPEGKKLSVNDLIRMLEAGEEMTPEQRQKAEYSKAQKEKYAQANVAKAQKEPAPKEEAVKVPANEQGFFSSVEKAAANLKREEGSGDAFLSDIMKFNPSAGELEATGIVDFLKGKKSVTRQEVQDYIDQHSVQIEEVVRGTILDDVDRQKLNDINRRISRGFQEMVTPEEEEWFEATRERLAQYKEPRFEQEKLILPGGKNYREILLKFPFKEPKTPRGYEVTKMEYDDGQVRFFANTPTTRSQGFKTEAEALEELNRLTEGLKDFRANLSAFRTNHWPDDPNTFMHLRMQDMTINGKKTLVIEEIQSDWHQTGRKEGYRTEGADKAEKDFKSYSNELADKYDLNPEQNLSMYATMKRMLPEEVEKYERLQSAWVNSKGGVPDAPFKKDWYQLGVKRLLRYAADNDYDQVALVGPDEQIRRGSLGTHIDGLIYEKNADGTIKLMAEKGESVVLDKTVEPKDLDLYVGKDVAKRILESKETDGTLTGDDLKIGGEGMRQYYGRNYPEYMNKLGRDYGTQAKKTQYTIKEFGPNDVEEVPTGEADRYGREVMAYQIRDPETDEIIAYETDFEKALKEANKKAPSTDMWVMDLPAKMKSDIKIGQPFKKGGLVQKERLMAAGGIAKLAKVGAKAGKEIADKPKAIQGAIESVSSRLAKDAEKNKSKPIASEKVIENTVTKAAERITKQNPKLSEEEVAKKAEREALAKLKWEREEKLAIEARYGELEAAKFDEPKSKRMRNVPEVVERRIEKAEEFLAQPTEAWQPPRTELQAFDRSLIREALEGFPGIEQTRFPRAQATRADLGYLEEIYGDPRNRALIEKQIRRGLPLGGETFYASLYPIKVAAMERGIPEAKFNQWVYENAPASARNSILNEMAVGQFLRDMNARGLPLDEQTVTEEMAKFKQQYGIGLPLMPVHREGVRSVIEGGQDLREMVKADIPTNYKIPTYGTQKAGDFGKSMVLDVHESAGQTMGSRYHPYFTEQGGFAPLEYGPAEAKMLEIAESLGIPGGMAQAGRWFGGGELTGLKSPRGDALDLLEKQTAYTLQGLGIKPTPKTVRNYILDMIETGQGVLMPYFKSEPLPDVRTKKRGGLAKASKARGGLAALQA